jgi:Flp pilus assembly protein TadD
MDPNHVAILNDMAYCHLNLDEIEEAKVYLLKAHEIDPEDYVVIGNLAYVSMKQGEYATAWEYAAILQKSEDPEYVEIGNEMMKEILELGMGEEVDSFQYVDDLF